MSDLSVLFPNRTLAIGDSTLEVRPFTFGQLPKVLAKARTIYGAIAHLLDAGSNEAAIVIEIMAVGGEDLLELVCLSIGKDRAFFDTLPMDEGVMVVAAFLEVNLGFFVQRVLPQFKDAMERVQAATGERSSPTSAATDSTSLRSVQ